VLLVNGVGDAAVCKALEGRHNLTGKSAVKVIADARRKITLAADFARAEEIGRAYHRLNDLYAQAKKGRDFRTALSVQRELDKLLGLYEENGDGDSAGGGAEDPRDAAMARQHLEALGFGRKGAPLAELARLAVQRIIEGKPRGRGSRPSRVDGRAR